MRETVFYLTDDHLKLLDRMYVGWDDAEYGAPAIDPKRPYGNSDVERDIAEILGWELADAWGDKYLDEQQSGAARRLHTEMQTALQIILHLRTFKTGRYVNNSYGIDWKEA